MHKVISTFRDSKYFAVNVLSESQRSTAGLFSSQSSEKFKITKNGKKVLKNYQ